MSRCDTDFTARLTPYPTRLCSKRGEVHGNNRDNALSAVAGCFAEVGNAAAASSTVAASSTATEGSTAALAADTAAAACKTAAVAVVVGDRSTPVPA